MPFFDLQVAIARRAVAPDLQRARAVGRDHAVDLDDRPRRQPLHVAELVIVDALRRRDRHIEIVDLVQDQQAVGRRAGFLVGKFHPGDGLAVDGPASFGVETARARAISDLFPANRNATVPSIT